MLFTSLHPRRPQTTCRSAVQRTSPRDVFGNFINIFLAAVRYQEGNVRTDEAIIYIAILSAINRLLSPRISDAFHAPKT